MGYVFFVIVQATGKDEKFNLVQLRSPAFETVTFTQLLFPVVYCFHERMTNGFVGKPDLKYHFVHTMMK